MSEITILPDGRVYAFGITCQIADLLRSLTSRLPAQAAEASTTPCTEVQVQQEGQ
jgi:hypothetical protein